MTEPVSLDEHRQNFFVGDVLAGSLVDSTVASLCRELFAEVPLSALQTASRELLAEYGGDYGPMVINISEEPARVFQGDDAVVGPLSLLFFSNGDVLGQIQIASGDYDQEERWPEMEGLLQEWGSLQGFRFDELTQDEWRPPASDVWTATFYLEGSTQKIGSVLNFLESAAVVAEAYSSSRFTSDVVRAVVRAGLASALIGVPEDQQFEVKRSMVLKSDTQKFEFAKDVAAMANAPAGGVILVGAETVNQDGRDVIVRLTPMKEAARIQRQMRAVIEAVVFPVPEGMGIEAASVSNAASHVIMISIPAQDSSLQPFLVSGVQIDGKVKSAFISVPIRSGEDTRYLGKAVLHSAISVGRAVLGGEYRLTAFNETEKS